MREVTGEIIRSNESFERFWGAQYPFWYLENFHQEMIDGVNSTGNTITKLIDGRLHGFPKIFEVSYSPVVDGVIARLIATFVDLTEYHRLLEENDAILNQLENTEGFKRFAYFRAEKNGANYMCMPLKIRSILG